MKQFKLKEEMFNTDKWVELKDAPISDIKTLMLYIEAYRSPQSHLEPREFLAAIQHLIEKFIKQELIKVREEIIENYRDYLKKRLLKGDPNDDPGLYNLLGSWLDGFLKEGKD